MAAEPIRVALVGYGYWGPNLARNFHQLTTARLAALCDLSPARLEEACGLYPDLKATTDYQALLNDPSIAADCPGNPGRKPLPAGERGSGAW